MHRPVRWFLGAAAVFLLAAPSLGALFRADGAIARNSFDYLDSYDLTLGIQAGGGVTYDRNGDAENPGIHAQANSLADIYGLHAHAFSQIINNSTNGGPNRLEIGAVAEAYGTYQDLVISGPAGGGPIPVSINLRLDGTLLVAGGDNMSTITRCDVAVGFQVKTGDTWQSIGYGGSQWMIGNGASPPILGQIDALVGWNQPGGNITTATFFVTPNVPFELAIRLTASSGVSGRLDQSFIVAANADFGSTLTFAVDRPVFNLPDGYTASSADAGIVGNQFVVPEPTTPGLLLTAGLLALRRRRERAVP
jgi:hypothetical protein